jgi:hypothetical protein
MAPIDKVCPKNKGVHIGTMNYFIPVEALEIEVLPINSLSISEAFLAAKTLLETVLFVDIALLRKQK